MCEPLAGVESRDGAARSGADAAARRLTAAIAAGDSEAFGVFYEAWFGRTYALARSLTRRDESFCLDVVQDVMLRVIRAVRPLPGERALAVWLYRCVHTTALDRFLTGVTPRGPQVPLSYRFCRHRIAWP